MRIYCPKCEYEPKSGDRWQCAPGCFTIWNTFDTVGRCPGCGCQWSETCCPACGAWSAHEDWYHDDDSDADASRRDEGVEVEELVPAGAP